MKRLSSCQIFLGIAVIASSALARTRPLIQLLSTLESGEYNAAVFFDLESYSNDARVVPALRRAFAQRRSKRDKQRIAVTLIHLNEKSDQYFDYLAKYAKEAIQDTTPSPLIYDRDGQLVRGETNLAFQQWCVAQGRDPKEVAGVYLVELPQDVWFLGDTRDARAMPLLKQALESRNPAIIGFAGEALALMRDVSAIPLIAQACERLPASDSVALAGMLAYYMSPEADRVMEQFIKDAKLRQGFRNHATWRLKTELDVHQRRRAVSKADDSQKQ